MNARNTNDDAGQPDGCPPAARAATPEARAVTPAASSATPAASSTTPARPSLRFLWLSLAVLGASLTVFGTAMAAQDAGATDAAQATVALSKSIGIWCAALMTIGILTFLYKDNPFYKVCESILIGVSAAYWMVNGFWSTLVPNLFGKLMPSVVREYAIPSLPVSDTPGFDMALAFVPLALGLMLLWRLAPKGGWISVWPLAFIIGTTAGIRLVASIEADLLAQASATIRPLVVMKDSVLAPAAGGGSAATAEMAATAVRTVDFWGTVGAVTGVVGVLSVLSYFFFSLEHKGAVGKSARLGVWFLMITFGSAFGLTVMGRITLLAQRLEFLFKDWLGLG